MSVEKASLLLGPSGQLAQRFVDFLSNMTNLLGLASGVSGCSQNDADYQILEERGSQLQLGLKDSRPIARQVIGIR